MSAGGGRGRFPLLKDHARARSRSSSRLGRGAMGRAPGTAAVGRFDHLVVACFTEASVLALRHGLSSVVTASVSRIRRDCCTNPWADCQTVQSPRYGRSRPHVRSTRIVSRLRSRRCQGAGQGVLTATTPPEFFRGDVVLLGLPNGEGYGHRPGRDRLQAPPRTGPGGPRPGHGVRRRTSRAGKGHQSAFVAVPALRSGLAGAS